MDIPTTTNEDKMKSISLFLFGFIVGTVFMAVLHTNQTHHQQKTISQPTTIELSIGGEVKVLKTDGDNSIHVITDENLVLTDIQVLPHSEFVTKPIPVKKEYGQPPSQTLSSSSP
jgi:hypothetical protein